MCSFRQLIIFFSLFPTPLESFPWWFILVKLVPPNFSNTTQIATLNVNEVEVLCPRLYFCPPICNFLYNFRIFIWAHGCWIKDHISQPSLGGHVTKFWAMGGSRSDMCKLWDLPFKGRNITFFLKFWAMGVSRSDVCKLWDLPFKGRNITFFLFPSLLLGMLM